uniref:Uncharacterized protein n=1 Tax=viral metagenome TaxID=1070528 RepID=A0A6H1Z5N5_9ZZZZ
MAGSIGGFPVHNYGSDPLGKMGLQMMQSSMDWDQQKKISEQKAMQEAAAGQRSAYMKTVEAGTAAPGSGEAMYGPGVGQGVDAMNKQAAVAEMIKKNQSILKFNIDNQTYTEKQITQLESAQKKMLEKKTELLDAGGQEDMVTYMNDQLKAMDGQISKLRGFSVGDSVLMSDIASWKSTRQEENVKQIAMLGTELRSAMETKNPIPEEINAASGKLQAAITIARDKWKLSKESFTLEADLLSKGAEAFKQNIINQLKPKEPKEFAPSNEDKAILDRMASLGLPDSPQNRDKVRTMLANDPSKSRDTALVSNTAFISKVLKIPEQEAIQLALKTKDSEGSVSDINKLGTMLESLANDKNPSKWKMALIEKTAEKLGWNLIKIDPKTKPGDVFGKVWPTTTEEGGYSLEPKKTKENVPTQKSAAPITATNPKTGAKVQWDGKRWIPAK